MESGELCVAQNTGEIVKELNAGQSLQVMVPDTDQDGIYGTGGKENPLKVWDIEKGETVFVAKNVRTVRKVFVIKCNHKRQLDFLRFRLFVPSVCSATTGFLPLWCRSFWTFSLQKNLH